MELSKRAGRPKSSNERVHVRLRGDKVINALSFCQKELDAAGPSEVVRVAIRNYVNILDIERKYGSLMAGLDFSRILFDRITAEKEIFILPEDGTEKFTHISLSNGVKANIERCLEHNDIDISSLVSLSIITLQKVLIAREDHFLFYYDDKSNVLPYYI